VTLLAVGELKQCSSCRETLPLMAFNRHYATADKLQNVCKKCKSVMTRNWRHSMRSGEYQALLELQDGRCAICRRTSTETLVVDHCHASGRRRGLLCRLCNALLGMAQDDVDVLQAAIEYLTEE
jgi:hypothetical protein